MTGSVDASTGKASLRDLNNNDLRTMFAALENDAEYHLNFAKQLDADADRLIRDAGKRRIAKVVALRDSGEVRNRAAGHRALEREARDLMRVILPLYTNPDSK